MIGPLVAVLGGALVVFFGVVGVLVQLSNYWYVTGGRAVGMSTETETRR